MTVVYMIDWPSVSVMDDSHGREDWELHDFGPKVLEDDVEGDVDDDADGEFDDDANGEVENKVEGDDEAISGLVITSVAIRVVQVSN